MGSTQGATFGASPTADAFVTPGPNSSLATNNYGGAGTLVIAAPGLPQGEFQSVLQFNLGDVVSGFNTQFGSGQWSLQTVTLQLTATVANNAAFNAPAAGSFVVRWMQNDSWPEGGGSPGAPSANGITFATLQSSYLSAADANLGTFGFTGATSGVYSYALGLPPGFVSDIMAAGNVSLRMFAADGSASGVFNSRNFGTVANRPLLTLVAVPEPNTLALAGLAVFAMTAGSIFSRKRSS